MSYVSDIDTIAYNLITSKYHSPKGQKVYYDYISLIEKFSFCPSFFPLFICTTCLLKYTVSSTTLSYQSLYRIHLFFPWRLSKLYCFCYSACHNNSKKISLFPFPFQPNVCSRAHSSLAIITWPCFCLPFLFCPCFWSAHFFFLAIFFLGPSIWSSQQSTHSSSIITLSVNFWLILN